MTPSSFIRIDESVSSSLIFLFMKNDDIISCGTHV
uniref:Uncharacterized protein n=1 Tax=Arundo donax TaxID=35708 RepID=A0A0A9CQ65_ARUDO